MRHARGLASTELISLFGANRRCPRAAPRPTWIQHTNKRQRAAQASRTAETHTRRLDIAPRLRYITVTHGIIPSLVRPSYYTATGVRGHPTSDRMRTRQDARPAGAQGRRKGSAPTISALSISPAPARAAAPSCRQITRRTQPPSPSPDSHWHRPAPLPHLQHTLAPSVSTASQHAASAHTHKHG